MFLSESQITKMRESDQIGSDIYANDCFCFGIFLDLYDPERSYSKICLYSSEMMRVLFPVYEMLFLVDVIHVDQYPVPRFLSLSLLSNYLMAWKKQLQRQQSPHLRSSWQQQQQLPSWHPSWQPP